MPFVCPACQHPYRESARYCDQCGQRLDAVVPPPKAERRAELRQATFLFCDLVQSTRMANQLALEDLRLVFRSLREVVAQATQRHDGYLMRFVGDGAFVSFGYPEAREDAAESALRAGLEMLRELRRSSPVPGVTLEMRVGVASGTVVVGEEIDESAVKEESVIGSVPHLAARLVALAPPGGLLIADATRRLAGRFFDYEDAGSLELKGFDHGVRGWLVRGESSVASRFEAQRDPTAPTELVGRQALIDTLLATWATARRGPGQVLMLRGEAGIGKSRLARLVRAAAEADGAVLLEIDCSARSRHTPLYPVSVLARRVARLRPQDDDAERTRRVDALLAQLLDEPAQTAARRYLGPLFGLRVDDSASAESPERVREQMIGLLQQIVLRYAAKGPVFLLCEDLHWADATTLELLQKLAGETAAHPMLLMATTRPETDGAGVVLPGATVHEVAPLGDAEAHALIAAAVGRDALSPAAVEAVVRRGEGVPLFLEELARNLVETGQGTEASAEALAAGQGMPDTLQAVVQLRVDRWPRLKPIVQAASVLGREFSIRLLQEVLGEQRPRLYEAVAQLVDHGVLLMRDPAASAESFRFRHALIHEAVYDTLLRQDRERLHSRAAEVLVQHFDGLPEASQDVLAHHLASARRYDEAVRCLQAATHDTLGRAAYAEAIGHARGGLALLPRLEAGRGRSQAELSLLTQLGVALAATRGYSAPEVESTYRQARTLCSDEGDAQALFPIVRGLGTYYFVRGDFADADDVSTQCLRLAEQSDQMALRIEALSFRGYTRLYLGHVAQAREALEQCTALYRAHDGARFVYPSVQDAGTAAWSLLGAAAWLQGDAAAAEQAVAEVLAHAQALSRPFDQAYAHVWVAMLRNLQRRYDDAERHAGACIAVSAEHGYTTWLYAAMMQDAYAKASRAPAAEAVQGLRMAMQGFIGAGARANIPYFLLGVARGEVLLQRPDAAREALAEARRQADAAREVYLVPELLMLEAELAPDPDAATALLMDAVDRAESQGTRMLAMRAALMALGLPGAAGRTEDETALWEALEGRAPHPAAADGWIDGALRAALQPQRLRPR